MNLSARTAGAAARDDGGGHVTVAVFLWGRSAERGLAREAKTGTLAGVMSAAEIIEMIEKLPVAEREQVRVYLEKKPVVAEEVCEIRYISDEKFNEILPKVFEQHHDLLRRLSQ